MELLKENNLMNLILKSPNIDDPFHINDVEPALYTLNFLMKEMYLLAQGIYHVFFITGHLQIN